MGTLDNGLTYYILPHSKPEERLELRLALKVGSLYEEEDQLGVAHFLEHMAFNGTDSFPDNSLIDYMESIGMSFGAHVNALTAFDRTVYQLHVPTDVEGAVEQSLLILKEQVGNQLLLDDAIEAERGVVLEEWRSSQGSMSRIQDDLLGSLLGEQYANRLPIGTKESIESFESEALRRFYDTWYRPDLMSVIAVGDLDSDEMEELIKSQFGELPTAPPIDVPIFSVRDHTDWNVVVLSDKEVTSAEVSVNFQENIQNGWKYTDYRRMLLQNIVTQALQVRLMELTFQEEPPFLNAGPSSSRFSADDVFWSLNATTESGGELQGLDALLEELERWTQYGITDSELKSVTDDILTSIESATIDRDNRKSNQLAEELVRSFIYNEPVPGVEVEQEVTKTLLAEITKEEVNSFSRAVFESASPSIQFVLPEKDGVVLPKEEEVLALVESVPNRKLKAPKDDVMDFHLMDRPTGGEIVERNRIEELDVTILRFGNGVEVWYKPTDYGDRVHLRSFSYGGATQYSEAEYQTAMVASGVALLSGMGDYSLMELGKNLNSIDAKVVPEINDFTEGMSGDSSSRHIEYMFQYLWNYFERPRFSKLMLKMIKRNQKNQIENMQNNPRTAATQTYIQMLWGDHYRFSPTTVEEVEAINLQDVERIYRERFENPADFRFFFVGNFDVQEFEALATDYIGTLETSSDQEQRIDDGLRFTTGDQKQTVYSGLEEKARVSLRWHGDWSGQWVERNHLNTMASVLEVRLRKRLREDLGGVYSVSVGQSTDQFPAETYYVTIRFGCDPQRVDELIAETEDIVASLLVEPPTEEEMATAREQDLQGREETVASNTFWAGNLSSAIRRQEDPLELLNYNDRVNNRTAEDIHQMANRVFKDNRTGSVILIHLPENMKPTE